MEYKFFTKVCEWKNVETELERFNKEGWEFVQAVSLVYPDLLLIFKKPKP